MCNHKGRKRKGCIETARVVAVFDKFFDMLNVSNFTNGARKLKPLLQPHNGPHDFRLDVSLYAYGLPIMLNIRFIAEATRGLSPLLGEMGK